MQADQRQDLGDETGRIVGEDQMRQFAFVDRQLMADDADRQIAETRVLRNDGQDGFDALRVEAIADHEAVGIARLEKAGGGFDGEDADQTGMLADADRKLRIGAPASGEDDRGIFDGIAARCLRYGFPGGLSGLGAAQDTLACSVRTRSTDATRAVTAAGVASRPIINASRYESVSSGPAQATTGTIGVLRVMSRDRHSASATSVAARRSARMIAVGSAAAMAAAASSQDVSMTGKAPAVDMASRSLEDLFSATTTIGPCNDINAHPVFQLHGMNSAARFNTPST